MSRWDRKETYGRTREAERRQTKSALGKPYPAGTMMWYPGDPEGHLYGFATRRDRDAHERGEPGPFERVIRPLDAPPPSDEVLLIRALCAGTLEETIEHLEARDPEKTPWPS